MTHQPPPPPELATVVPFPSDPQRAAEQEPAVIETELLLKIRDTRDSKAFSELFGRFAPKIKGYLQRTGLNPEDAENILQDIMIAVWNKARLFDPLRASARTWIYSLARNRLIDIKRAEQREHLALERYSGETADQMVYEEDLLARAVGQNSVALLHLIPPEQARVLLMAYVEGKSHREISRELNLPIGTVKSRARLAFQRIRGLLETAQ
jgi:RNA polymerase sigma-70 factor (ECF subfamily)